MINDKKVLFSGMQATGSLTLGNYLGALKNWLTLSAEEKNKELEQKITAYQKEQTLQEEKKETTENKTLPWKLYPRGSALSTNYS